MRRQVPTPAISESNSAGRHISTRPAPHPPLAESPAGRVAAAPARPPGSCTCGGVAELTARRAKRAPARQDSRASVSALLGTAAEGGARQGATAACRAAWQAACPRSRGAWARTIGVLHLRNPLAWPSAPHRDKSHLAHVPAVEQGRMRGMHAFLAPPQQQTVTTAAPQGCSLSGA